MNFQREGMIMRRTVVSALIFLMTTTFLRAEEPSNMISGTVGDRAVDVPVRVDQSDFYGDGNAGGVSIMTMPIARDDGLGAVSIGFEGSDFLRGNFISFEIDITDVATENMSSYFSNLDHDLQIAITKAEKQDGLLSIAGTVQGTLIWRQLMPISERKEDPSRQLPINLEFDVVVENEY